MSNVFVLTDKDYESLDIKKVFTNKEKLDAYIKVLNEAEEEADYVEVELDPEPPKIHLYANLILPIMKPINENSYNEVLKSRDKPLSEFFEPAQLSEQEIYIHKSIYAQKIDYTCDYFECCAVIPGEDGESEEELKNRTIEYASNIFNSLSEEKKYKSQNDAISDVMKKVFELDRKEAIDSQYEQHNMSIISALSMPKSRKVEIKS